MFRERSHWSLLFFWSVGLTLDLCQCLKSDAFPYISYKPSLSGVSFGSALFSWIATVFGLLTPFAIWLYLDFISFPDHFLLLILTFFKKHSSIHISVPYIFSIIFFLKWFSGEERRTLPTLLGRCRPLRGRRHRALRVAGNTPVQGEAPKSQKSRGVFFFKSERGTKPCHGIQLSIANVKLSKSRFRCSPSKSKREFGAERHPRLRHLA